MADDMNNDELERDDASEGMPEDLKRLLARANEDEAGGYDPDAESDEEEDDDEELEESFGANDRGEDAGTDVNGGSLQISEFGREMKQSFMSTRCRSSPPVPCRTCATASSRSTAASCTR